MTNDVVETITFETETSLKLQEWDFIKIPRPKIEIWDRDLKFVHFAEIFFVKAIITPEQGCGVGVEESESEGFSTWGVGVGVVENFNDSDSG